jgi:hypothetical protein
MHWSIRTSRQRHCQHDPRRYLDLQHPTSLTGGTKAVLCKTYHRLRKAAQLAEEQTVTGRTQNSPLAGSHAIKL